MTENILAILLGAILFIFFLAMLQVSLLIYKFVVRLEEKMKNLNEYLSNFRKRNNGR